jgi:pimeloyl-ACP methyl ester carboxylesterase
VPDTPFNSTSPISENVTGVSSAASTTSWLTTNDRMVPSTLSEDLHRRIEGSELIIYSDSGHGGIFQFHDKFAAVVAEFLGR